MGTLRLICPVTIATTREIRLVQKMHRPDAKAPPPLTLINFCWFFNRGNVLTVAALTFSVSVSGAIALPTLPLVLCMLTAWAMIGIIGYQCKQGVRLTGFCRRISTLYELETFTPLSLLKNTDAQRYLFDASHSNHPFMLQPTLWHTQTTRIGRERRRSYRVRTD